MICNSRARKIISSAQNLKIKSDRINVLRKQYDAFLEDDKKRRQRNEYILGSFDKISSCKTIIQIRHRHADFGRISAINRNGLFSEMQPTYDIKMSRLPPTQLNISSTHTEDSMLINELSKKFILIPKLNPNTALVEQTFFKPSIDQSDWTSKYKILDTLKHGENKPYDSPENEVSSLKKENVMHLSDQKSILWQNQDVPTKDNTDIASLSILKNTKEYRDNEVVHKIDDTRKLNPVSNNKDIKPTNPEILSHNSKEENFSILNNNKKLSLIRDGDVPTTSDYEYKSEKDIHKPTKTEGECRYGPFGPQTEPFTYEYKYKKDTDGIDYNSTNQSIKSIERPCNSTEKQSNDTVLITEDKGDNLKEESTQESILENKEEINNSKTEQNKVNPDNAHPKNASQTLNIESGRVNSTLFKQTDPINQNWNPPCADVNYKHDNFNDKPSIQQDEPSEQQQIQQRIETINPSEQVYVDNINDSPLTQYEPSLVYDPTETSYEQETSSEMQQLNEQSHIGSQQNYDSNVPAFETTQQHDQAEAIYAQDLNNLHEDQYNLVQQQQVNTNQQELDPNQQQQLNQQEYDARQHYNDNQQNYEPNQEQQLSQDQQEYDSQQQQYTENQQYYEPDQHQQLTNNLQEYDSDHLKQYDESQQEYGNNQMYNAVQQQYDPVQQQQFSQNQQEYDPQQQHNIQEGYDANEAEYEKTQDEYESNQNQYDPNQVTYEPSQQHYDDNTTGFDIPEQEYDPNQQTFDTNTEDFEVYPQHAVSDPQYSEPVLQEHEQQLIDSKKQLTQANYDEMREPEMTQQISNDGKNKLITRESLQPLQSSNQDIKTPTPKSAKEKKEADSKNLGVNKKTKSKDQTIEQTKVARKLRS